MPAAGRAVATWADHSPSREAVLSTSHTYSLQPTKQPSRQLHSVLHRTDEETEAQRGEVTGPTPHSPESTAETVPRSPSLPTRTLIHTLPQSWPLR